MVNKKRTIAEYKLLLGQDTVEETILAEADNDERASVRQLADKWRARKAKREAEKARFREMLRYEEAFRKEDYQMIAGIDEAGRGPLAGPVSIGACILPPDCFIEKLNDSKKLSEKQRDILYDKIIECAVAWKVIFVSEEDIDRKNIYQATVDGMYQAIAELNATPDAVLVDAVPLPKLSQPSHSLIKGDQKSASIAAASILAKVSRDRLMEEYDRIYPQYGFAKHKGYGTAEHVSAIREYGPCPIHRKTFEPVASILKERS